MHWIAPLNNPLKLVGTESCPPSAFSFTRRTNMTWTSCLIYSHFNSLTLLNKWIFLQEWMRFWHVCFRMCVCVSVCFLSPCECASGWDQPVFEPAVYFYLRSGLGECWAAPALHGASAGHQADCPGKREVDHQRMNSHLQHRGREEREKSCHVGAMVHFREEQHPRPTQKSHYASPAEDLRFFFSWSLLPPTHLKKNIHKTFLTRTNICKENSQCFFPAKHL